jgi:hypothetical protein
MTLALPAAAGARDFLVLLPATGSNVADGHLAAATDVLRAHLERAGFRVERALSTAPPGLDPSSAQAAEAARGAGADLAVTLRVARLGDTFSARLGAYRPDGALSHADELGGRGPDDLDPVLERLALALARERTGRTVAQIHTVTVREEAPLLKQRANAGAAIRLGVLTALDRPDALDRESVLSGLGIAYHHDARTYLVDLGVEAYTSNIDPRTDPDRALVVAMNVAVPLGKGNVAPFVSAGAGMLWGTFGGAGASGIQARAATGFLLGRLTDVPVRFELGYFWNLFAEREAGTGRDVRVHGLSAAIVLSAIE